MSTADKWADPKAVGGGTVQSKAAERAKLAKLMDDYIAKNGPIEQVEGCGHFLDAPSAEYLSKAKKGGKKGGRNSRKG